MARVSNTIPDIYKYYDDNYEYKVDYKIYRDIISNFFKLLSDNLIVHGKTVKLPFNLGYLDIVKSRKWFKANKLSVDFKSTNELGKTIYYLNDHTDGYKYMCHWSKVGSKIRNINKYRFVLTRTNKRNLAQIIFNKEKDYIER